MPLSDERITRKKSPYIVSVNRDETENFMNDIIKEVSKLSNKPKFKGRVLFLKSFLIGFFVFCLCLFFLYTSYYFIEHALLHK